MEKLLVIAPSGFGKTTSLRNLDPEETMVIQCVKKRLPFPAKGWKKWDKETKTGSYLQTRDFNVIKAMLSRCEEVGKKVVVIDDFVYALAGRVMDDIDTKGFDKWSELADEFYRLIEHVDSLNEDMIFILMSHSEIEDGFVKMKTAGKLIDNLLTPAGMFNVVLGMSKNESGHNFITNGTSLDPFKSPMGMFKDKQIPNDMKVVIDTIREFYGIE